VRDRFVGVVERDESAVMFRAASSSATGGSAATGRVSRTSPGAAAVRQFGGQVRGRAEIVEAVVDRRRQGRAAVDADPQRQGPGPRDYDTSN
jgi:hypothetical protein